MFLTPSLHIHMQKFQIPPRFKRCPIRCPRQAKTRQRDTETTGKHDTWLLPKTRQRTKEDEPLSFGFGSLFGKVDIQWMTRDGLGGKWAVIPLLDKISVKRNPNHQRAIINKESANRNCVVDELWKRKWAIQKCVRPNILVQLELKLQFPVLTEVKPSKTNGNYTTFKSCKNSD